SDAWRRDVLAPIKNENRLPQLLQFFLGLCMARMPLKKFQKDFARLLRFALQSIEPGEVQVRLIKFGRYSDRPFESPLPFLAAGRAQVKDAQVIQCFWVNGARSESLLQILISFVRIVELCKDHAEAVVCFRICGAQLERSPENALSFLPALL